MKSVSSRREVAGVVACVLLLALTYIAAFHLTWFQRADQNAVLAFYDLIYLYYPAHPNGVLRFFVSVGNPWPYVLLATLCIGTAAARGQFRAAAAAAIVLIGATATTFVLKMVLPEPHIATLVPGLPPVASPRWPSGHTTAAVALALSAVLVAPPRLRIPAAVAGTAFATLVAVGLLVLGSHMPSDVLAGYLVATGWCLFAVRGRFAGARQTLSMRHVVVALLLSLGLAAACVVLTGPHAIVSYAGGHGRFVAGVLVIAALLAVACLAVAGSDVRRSAPRD